MQYGESRDVSTIQLQSVIPMNPTLSDFVAANNTRDPVGRAPPLRHIRPERYSDALDEVA